MQVYFYDQMFFQLLFYVFKKKMIKQYDFPIIFHNVVGQVVPIRKKKNSKQDPSLGLVCALYEQVKSIEFLRVPKQANGKLQIQSKKKKLVRRLDFSKTSAWFDGKNPQQQSDKHTQSEDKATFSNFLKRKKTNIKINKKQSISSDRLHDSYFLPQKMAFFDIQSKDKNKIKRVGARTNNLRIRTSLNQSQNTRHNSRDYKQGRSIHQTGRDSNFDDEKDEIIEDHSKAIKKRRQKQKHKTFFKNDSPEERKYNQEPQQIRRGERKRTKKKTVNFNINSQKENSQVYIRKNSRNATKIIKNFGQKSLRMNHNNSQQQFVQGDKQSESQWTAKSVVSIKLSSNAKMKSKKSLRSQQSILQDSDNFLFKKTTTYKRYGTKKIINMSNSKVFSLKKVKSMMSLSSATIKQRSTKNVTKQKMPEVKLQKSEKVIKNTTKRTKNKISILIKSRDPFLLSQSTKSIDLIRSSNYQDLVFQKSKKNLMKSMKIQGSDAFAELNNFHRFLNENDNDDNQLQIPKVMTKPMVIESSINHKEVLDRKIFNNQCKMIDMGLTLIKKLSILKQKKY